MERSLKPGRYREMANSKQQDVKIGRLFPEVPPFRLVRLGESAARKQTDELKILESMLLEAGDMYPGIDRWYIDKVIPGLRTSERAAYLAFENEQPVAVAVLKLGEHSKFCHVSIREGFRNLRLGQMIFTQMAFQARHQKEVKDIHFTLPEREWNDNPEFFKAFGFDDAVRSFRQYRQGEDELYCSAPISTIWDRTLEKIHTLGSFSPGGFSFEDKVLLSMHSKYAELVFSGVKKVEIRTKFPRRWTGRQAVVYGTQPLGSLMGEVTLTKVVPGTPSQIWEQYGADAGCTFEEYSAYVGDRSEVFAILISDLKPYLAPVGIAQISHLIKEDLHPPQSFVDVKMDKATPWVRALSVAGLLHSWR
jgi:predicted transcriptional regulator